MKLAIIGLGQCGCRIADQFARLNLKAQSVRKATIAPIVMAVNADQADLTGLTFIKKDYMHRIVIGLRQTLGHGVGKVNELGAMLAKEDGDKVLDAVKAEPGFYQTHAFLLVAGVAGGTGSGALPIVAKMVKERYISKPVFALCVLPFEHEQLAEDRSVFNSAVSLRSVFDVVDAVFLADNQRYVRKDVSLINNMDKINKQIVEPFYDLMCVGEVTKAGSVGTRTVDGGDVIASLKGWTAFSVGRTEMPAARAPWQTGKESFREKARESFRGTQALDATLSDLSVACDPRDAGRGLYLISGPAKQLNMDMVKSVSGYIKELAPGAVIRGGDFPGENRFIDITVILSELSFVSKVKEYYERATSWAEQHKGQVQEIKRRVDSLAEVGKDLPTLM